MGGKQLEVLIVEDNPGDARLIFELLKDTGLSIHTSIAQNGQIALDMLRKEDGHSTCSIPDLVILDLNLPKVHGFDILGYMNATDNLRSIPVVVMTGSLNKADEETARSLGVTDYCTKPASAADMDSATVCLKRHLEALTRRNKN
jgi:CheY-like chemotaxis protein